eukprot:SAG22_NODE_45_length_24718_cov_12.462448_2_plen_197_part_00
MAAVTVCGYASLMDEASARSTTPSLTNWRYGWVGGWVRVFDLVSIINLRRGLGRDDRLVTCTARPAPGGQALRVCLYDVPAEEYPTLLARERRLVEQEVQYTDDAGGEAAAAAEPHAVRARPAHCCIYEHCYIWWPPDPPAAHLRASQPARRAAAQMQVQDRHGCSRGGATRSTAGSGCRQRSSGGRRSACTTAAT